MKEVYSIFVEGVADKRFVEQLIKFVFDADVPPGSVIVTQGYASLTKSSKIQTYSNLMKRTSDEGGVNLVIFDGDNDIESRRMQLLDWKKANNVDFELFLLPDNTRNGELEDLLVQIINPANQPVMRCWDDYESSLKQVILPWKSGGLTLPAKKTRIYAYLEALLGSSRSEKDKIKEINRDYLNKDFWNLDADALSALIHFLKMSLFLILQCNYINLYLA